MQFHDYNIRDLQYHVGIQDTDKGIVTLSVENSLIEDLLKDYVQDVDFTLLFQYTNRELRYPYAMALKMGNMEYIKRSILTSLMNEKYNLETLIGTTQLEYDPLENYHVEENIITTSSINARMTVGAVTTNTTMDKGASTNTTTDNLGEIVQDKENSMDAHKTTEIYQHGQVTKTTETTGTESSDSFTDTLQHTTGKQSNTRETNDIIGSHTDTETETKNLGQRKETTDTTNEVSAYNTSTYQPDSSTNQNITSQKVTDVTDTTKTVGSHEDTHSTTDSLGERIDKDTNIYGGKTNTTEGSTTETTPQYVDEKITQSQPYSEHDILTTNARENTSTETLGARTDSTKEVVDEHENNNVTDSEENRDRLTHGRYGYTTTQSLIEAQRNLANLNIVEKIIEIILKDLTSGVLYTC